MDQEEQFKVELFESITKLNKFREFSKSSYKEINSKCCCLWWSYAGQRIAGFYYRKCLRDCHRFCEFEAGIKKSAGGQIVVRSSVEADLFEQGLSRDLYIESLLNRVELGGVFCWSKQRCRVMFRLKVHTYWCRGKIQDKHFYKSFKKASFQVLADYLKTLVAFPGYGKSQRKINKEVWRDTSLWSVGKRNLRTRRRRWLKTGSCQGCNWIYKVQGSSGEDVFRSMKLRSIFSQETARRCREIHKMSKSAQSPAESSRGDRFGCRRLTPRWRIVGLCHQSPKLLSQTEGSNMLSEGRTKKTLGPAEGLPKLITYT
ncbi:hypothetical protein F2Q70_00002477 [Brassica cretica]|uniref:Uncharacterized protein n=1 Tax=Brassica cretica TaxID=69181 RepID=A0A8S9IU75_BRACR|nr:hypothetical protein F2Q70_00002477 [Brassica cretica]